MSTRSGKIFRHKLVELQSSEGFAAKWLLLAFVLSSIAVVSRDRSLFTHAQFYAEDGKIWFAQAYNEGWFRPLFIPDGGYFNTVQRLIADSALLVPFRWAPLVMALGGLGLQALPVPILLSKRCRNWGPMLFRLLFAAVYVGIPDAREIHVVCTNSQWHLAVAMVLLAFAAAPEGMAGRLLDLVILSVGALSGPFALLLAPLAAIYWLIRRQRWSLIVVLVLSLGGLIQLLALLKNSGQRKPPMFLGASVGGFVRLTGGNAFLGGILGTHSFGVTLPLICSLAALIVGLALIVACCRISGPEFRLFSIFCFAVYAAGLRSPYFIYSPNPLWTQLLLTPSQRYSFFPSLALLFAILWCALYGRGLLRGLGIAVAVFACFGVLRDWKIPPIPYWQFPQQAAAFEAAAPGTTVVIPVYPVLPDWQMVLVRKPGN